MNTTTLETLAMAKKGEPKSYGERLELVEAQRSGIIKVSSLEPLSTIRPVLSRMVLPQELLEELKSTKSKLRQAEMGLQEEREASRQLYKEFFAANLKLKEPVGNPDTPYSHGWKLENYRIAS
jgi:hypothetical protein